MSFGSNMESLRAQRALGNATQSLNKSFERLSSGLRINRASDDAAGLAIADNLKTITRLHAQSIRNVNDGVSALNIIDGTLNDQSNLLARLLELAEQSANGTYSSTQRTALSKE